MGSPTRKYWLRSVLAGLGILVAPVGASAVWAQSIDPFRPFNSQYDAYRYPIGPATPEGGGNVPMALGVRGANQYQNYLNDLQGGVAREGAERYGIGMPYYRTAIDPRFDRDGSREYRPNSKTDSTFEQTQELITEKYFAFFTEKDPKKRAELLREFNRSRSKITRALSARRENPERFLESVNRKLESRPAAETGRRTDTMRKPAESKSRTSPAGALSSKTDSDSGGDGLAPSIPPAPPLFPGLGTRAGRTRRSPADILNRSLRMNSDDDTLAPGAPFRAPARSTTGTNRRKPLSDPATPPPSVNN